MNAKRRTDGQRQRILLLQWLAIALFGSLLSACCPHPPGFVPRIPSECSNWDSTLSRHEIRGLTNDIADGVPDWQDDSRNWRKPGSVPFDAAAFKTAAIKMARAPQCVHRAVLESYMRAYGEDSEADDAKISGLFVLMRVLFVLPTHYTKGDGRNFAWFDHPPRGTDGAYDMSWPVHEDPSGSVLEIDRCRGASMAGGGLRYNAVREYEYFAERFPLRSLAAIQALTIRARPSSGGGTRL